MNMYIFKHANELICNHCAIVMFQNVRGNINPELPEVNAWI